jgi:hypothetical protein
MKGPIIFVLLSVFVAGCVSKPAARVETVASVASDDAPLAVGDCVYLECTDGCMRPEPWRRTVDAEGYLTAYLGIKVKIAGMTLTEAGDAIASVYVQRNILRRPPGLLLHRCQEYDRERLEIEQRIKQAKKGKPQAYPPRGAREIIKRWSAQERK